MNFTSIYKPHEHLNLNTNIKSVFIVMDAKLAAELSEFIVAPYHIDIPLYLNDELVVEGMCVWKKPRLDTSRQEALAGIDAVYKHLEEQHLHSSGIKIATAGSRKQLNLASGSKVKRLFKKGWCHTRKVKRKTNKTTLSSVELLRAARDRPLMKRDVYEETFLNTENYTCETILKPEELELVRYSCEVHTLFMM